MIFLMNLRIIGKFWLFFSLLFFIFAKQKENIPWLWIIWRVFFVDTNTLTPQSFLEFIIIEMEKGQAAGSIWNVNSWHWEMKNYVEPAKKILEQNLLALVFQVSPELHINHKKVRFPKAEC